jgi:hypothetical protein
VAKRARHAAEGGITPAKPGSAQASLARRARQVEVFHPLFTPVLLKIRNCISPTRLIFTTHSHPSFG